mgnify:CR=1 FL=1
MCYVLVDGASFSGDNDGCTQKIVILAGKREIFFEGGGGVFPETT